jgi:hypothetical protein
MPAAGSPSIPARVSSRSPTLRCSTSRTSRPTPATASPWWRRVRMAPVRELHDHGRQRERGTGRAQRYQCRRQCGGREHSHRRGGGSGIWTAIQIKDLASHYSRYPHLHPHDLTHSGTINTRRDLRSRFGIERRLLADFVVEVGCRHGCRVVPLLRSKSAAGMARLSLEYGEQSLASTGLIPLPSYDMCKNARSNRRLRTTKESNRQPLRIIRARAARSANQSCARTTRRMVFTRPRSIADMMGAA